MHSVARRERLRTWAQSPPADLAVFRVIVGVVLLRLPDLHSAPRWGALSNAVRTAPIGLEWALGTVPMTVELATAAYWVVLVATVLGTFGLFTRTSWLVVAVVIAIVFLSTIVEIRLPIGWDGRPNGSIEDVASLKDRDDLNILFVVVDTLRAERLGSYGYSRATSPQLDRLAETGVRFARHLAQSSWTKASMASMWTGLYPARTGITRFVRGLHSPVE